MPRHRGRRSTISVVPRGAKATPDDIAHLTIRFDATANPSGPPRVLACTMAQHGGRAGSNLSDSGEDRFGRSRIPLGARLPSRIADCRGSLYVRQSLQGEV